MDDQQQPPRGEVVKDIASAKTKAVAKKATLVATRAAVANPWVTAAIGGLCLLLSLVLVGPLIMAGLNGVNVQQHREGLESQGVMAESGLPSDVSDVVRRVATEQQVSWLVLAAMVQTDPELVPDAWQSLSGTPSATPSASANETPSSTPSTNEAPPAAGVIEPSSTEYYQALTDIAERLKKAGVKHGVVPNLDLGDGAFRKGNGEVVWNTSSRHKERIVTPWAKAIDDVKRKDNPAGAWGEQVIDIAVKWRLGIPVQLCGTAPNANADVPQASIPVDLEAIAKTQKGLGINGLQAIQAISSRWPQIKTFGGNRYDANAQFHAKGRAVDVMIPDYKSNVALGQAIAEFAWDNREALGVSEILWNHKIITVQRQAEGWRHVGDRGGDTANHEDHVHLSFNEAKAPGLPSAPTTADSAADLDKATLALTKDQASPAASASTSTTPAPSTSGAATPDKLVVQNSQGQKLTLTKVELTHAAQAIKVVTDNKDKFGDEAGQQKAMVAAIITMLVESNMRNVGSKAVPESLQYPHDEPTPAGDHDSVGLFQQRAKTGAWGSVKQIMDPTYSAGMFLGTEPQGAPKGHARGLLQISNWQSTDVGVLAQKVQVSAFPDRYAAWVGAAPQVIKAASSIQVSGQSLGSSGCAVAGSDASPGGASMGVKPASGQVVSPIADGAKGVITSARYERYPSGGAHWGIDLASGSSWTIQSVCDGTVKAIKVNQAYANSNAQGTSGSTNYVWIDCGNNVLMGYAHFYAKDLNKDLKEGQKIGAGTPLFPQGNQGNSSGPHLHFQISTSGSMAYSRAATVDPIAYLAGLGIQLPKASY